MRNVVVQLKLGATACASASRNVTVWRHLNSVLEARVGRDFLPRGNDICTRRPLVLQLVQTKRKGDSSEEEWGEFLHRPDKLFFDFSEIRSEIEAVTAKEVGGNKGVSDKQIRLKIFSPNVLDITLVDLPGITKTRKTQMLFKSQELLIPMLDIMDRGTDARILLLGKVVPLRLGYVGVVNRSQEDINLNRTVRDALAAEEKFFCSHPHIKGLLSVLKSRISDALVSTAKEHASYGEITESKDIFAQLGSQSTIELPPVVVVGSQNSGKSSVLEALVGRDFLPRGNDICTRWPLVLQLVQTKRKGDGSEEEWGEFLHRPDKRFFDFSEIRSEIEVLLALRFRPKVGYSIRSGVKC
ncbi:Dynamin-related protein 3A [Linum perenne]